METIAATPSPATAETAASTATSRPLHDRTGSAADSPEGDCELAFFLWDEMALFVGPTFDARCHRHHTVELCFALDGSLDLEAAGGVRLERAKAVLVAPRVAHRLRLRGRCMASLMAGPLTPMGRSLQAGLGDRTARPLDGPEVEARAPALRRLLAAPDLTAARRTGDDLGTGVGIQAPCAPVDRRVLAVLGQLGSGFSEATPVATYAASVHLSESRFAHLFRHQVGLPLRSYRRWLRLRAALALSLAGDDLTTAAHDAGFADLPDFSRLCRSTFGVPPSRLTRRAAHFEAAVAGYPIRSAPGLS